MSRTTCLRCEQTGVSTTLIFTANGGVCPIHEPEFLAKIIDHAKLTLGIPLKFIDKGKPTRNGVEQ